MSKENAFKPVVSSESPSKKLESDRVQFLGQMMPVSEYEECCRNLKAVFDILRSWRKKESDESTEL